MCRGPRRAEDKNVCGAVATPKGGGGGGGTSMVPLGRRPRVVRVHIHELALTGVGPYWLLFVPGVARYLWIGWVDEGAFF